MQSPDNALTRKAQLRRALVEAFVAGDIPAWRAATAEMARMLRTEGLSQSQNRSEKVLIRRALMHDAPMSSRFFPKKARGARTPAPAKPVQSFSMDGLRCQDMDESGHRKPSIPG